MSSVVISSSLTIHSPPSLSFEAKDLLLGYIIKQGKEEERRKNRDISIFHPLDMYVVSAGETSQNLKLFSSFVPKGVLPIKMGLNL